MVLVVYVPSNLIELRNKRKGLVARDSTAGSLTTGWQSLMLGCKKLVLVAFDACVNKQTGYAKCIGHKPIRTSSGDERRFLTHRKRILEAAKGLEIEWLIPETEYA